MGTAGAVRVSHAGGSAASLEASRPDAFSAGTPGTYGRRSASHGRRIGPLVAISRFPPRPGSDVPGRLVPVLILTDSSRHAVRTGPTPVPHVAHVGRCGDGSP